MGLEGKSFSASASIKRNILRSLMIQPMEKSFVVTSSLNNLIKREDRLMMIRKPEVENTLGKKFIAP
jgi:hypothetical protein